MMGGAFGALMFGQYVESPADDVAVSATTAMALRFVHIMGFRGLHIRRGP